ncbi:PQQ-binding-like beta-propeller repeat protein [Micromonospora sp. NPDC049366]|uniref:outer membrane protein assembly factor BamB family protein n=1 Tax=Micromonospora sp. NPDC049366 TaxID=3364271 RepID=UPI0037B303C8
MATVTSGPMIDLGELRHEPEPDRLPRPPRAVGRPLRCALALVLLLACLTGSVPTLERAEVVLPARLGADALLVGDLVMIIDPFDGSGDRRLAAYRLPGGEPAWESSLPAQGRYWGMSSVGGMLVVTGHQGGSGVERSLTVVLDLETGAYRWQQPGRPLELADGNLLLESIDPDLSGTLRAVDPCCGAPRWTIPVAGHQVVYRYTGTGVDRIALISAEGRVEVFDAVTGALRVGADLWQGERNVNVQLIGDLLVAVGDTPGTVTGYDLDRLQRRWQTRVGDALYAGECDPVICVGGRDVGLWVLDPATGRQLWTDDRWAGVWSTGGRLLVGAASTAGPGAEQLAVLDPSTGAVLGELGLWEMAFPARRDQPLVGTRRHPDGGLLVAELDAGAGTARLLDVLSDAGGECQGNGDRLLCRRTDGAYGVWWPRR